MKLGDIDDWTLDVRSYWYDIIENTSYLNKEEMKLQVDGFLSVFDGRVKVEYLEIDDLYDLFVSNLTYIFSYVTMKFYVITNPSKEIPDLSVINNNDLRTLFNAFDYNLPSNFGSLFTVSDLLDEETQIPTENGIIEESGILSLYDDIFGETSGVPIPGESFLEKDEAKLESLSGEIIKAVNSKIIFMLFKQPEPEIINNNDFDTVRFILDDMKMWDLLQKFGWEIEGVSWNPAWGEYNA